MGRLTQKDDLGNWCVKGLPWKDTYVGSLITKNTEEKMHAAFCKLLEYEETGLSPEQIEILQEENKDLILDNKVYVEENEKLLKRLTEGKDE